MLLEGGVPVSQALDMAAGLLSAPLAGRLAFARRRIQEGAAISAALAEAGLSTPIADRLLRVGERGGSMGELMHRIAAFLEDDLARWVEWFTRLFEPVLMAVIGILIGTIVALMYVPIFDLAGSIQ
jgi:general secretion pathway protein F